MPALHHFFHRYLTTKLEANELDVKTHLNPQCYVPDTPGEYDTCDKENLGWMARREFFGNTEITDATTTPPTTKFAWDTAIHTFVGVLKMPVPDINFLPHV